MKTIEEIKNEVAVKHGCTNWIILVRKVNCGISYTDFINIENEVATKYAKQCCDEQIKACAENVAIRDEELNPSYELAEFSILNTPNVVTTKPCQE